jgi:hypothetical protein
MGRGTAELMVNGKYSSLDMSPFHYDRIVNKTPIIEKAVI